MYGHDTRVLQGHRIALPYLDLMSIRKYDIEVTLNRVNLVDSVSSLIR